MTATFPATLRQRPMTPDDAGRWAALLIAAAAVDRTGEHCDEADCAVSLTDPGVDLARDSVLVLDGDRPVACQPLYGADPDGSSAIDVDGVVHPEHRRRGIGSALLAAARRRAAELGAEVHVRVPEAVPAFADHFGSDPESVEAIAHRRTAPAGFRPDCSAAVCTPDGTVVGFLLADEFAAATAHTGRRDLYVATVGTTPDRRGRGVATALLAHALQRARAGGYSSSSLHVDAQNPTGALGVYRRAGYLPVARQVTYALPAPS